jgi:hypothetical protein
MNRSLATTTIATATRPTSLSQATDSGPSMETDMVDQLQTKSSYFCEPFGIPRWRPQG